MVNDAKIDLQTLQSAFEMFTQTTQTMEESYRRLEQRLADMDRELADKNRELAITSDYLNSILESISDGVIAIDTDGRITAFNKAASAILGYAACDVREKAFADLFGRDFAAPKTSQFLELRSEQGLYVPVSERDAPLSDRAGNQIGRVKVFQDLTEIEALRNRLAQQDRLAAVGQLAATVAHEIRNPLGGIRGFAALLSRDIAADDPRHRLVEKIERGAKDLERVVTELLEYTRPMPLQMRPANVHDLTDAALNYLEIGDKSIEIRNSARSDIRVLADPDRMRQVLLNLFMNAVQSMESPGVLTIESSLDGDSVVLNVTDTGCGMTHEQRKQIFTPFFTTKEKGTGLGLALAEKIVTAHGGVIEVNSEPGAGSTFKVCLPRME
ncbi:MAG: PAS domain-containing sensor histidine kinase [Candidatus Hydrogenedentota bacterium]